MLNVNLEWCLDVEKNVSSQNDPLKMGIKSVNLPSQIVHLNP